MPAVPRNAASSRGRSSLKDAQLASGKENARSSLIASKKASASAHREEARRRVSLSSNDEKKKEDGAGRATRAIAESFSAKKTPFHVHCDEKNVAEGRGSKETLGASSSADAEDPAASVLVRKQPFQGAETQRLLPQKRSTGNDKESKRILPSKIPRRARSISVPGQDVKSQGRLKRSASAESKSGSRRECWCKASALKFGWTSGSRGRAIEKRAELKLPSEGGGIAVQKTDDGAMRLNRGSSGAISVKGSESKMVIKSESKDIDGGLKARIDGARGPRREIDSGFKLNRIPFVANKIGGNEFRAIDRIKARLLDGSRTRIGARGSRSSGGRTATPLDGAAPPSIALKGLDRRVAKPPTADPRELEEQNASKEREFFPYELLYHAEYQNDLPIVEYKREEQSPQLSEDFLEQHINAEQRRLVVTFIIRLGNHCRYPSFIVYQAVKIFDAAIDRIPVKTSYIQLAALACLWIALKKQQNFHKIPMATTMVGLAGELYVGREDLLLDYEKKILLVLNFNVTFADVFSLFTYYLISCWRYIDIKEETITFLYHAGGYLIDLTLLDERFCRISASLVALTATELALGLVVDAVVVPARPRWLFWRGLLFAAASPIANRFEDKEMDQSRVTMLRCVLSSGRKHCDFEVVYKKYSRSRHGRISVPLMERASRIADVEIFDF